VRRRWDAIVLMGPPGSGKSVLGHHLAARGIAAYQELEPILRERFGAEDAFRTRKQEALAFLADAYREQIASSPLPVAIESTGLSDRPNLERLMREHRVALAHLRVPRETCVERVVGRPPGDHLSDANDRERIGGFYDFWYAQVFPTYRFDLVVDGADVEAAAAAIRAFFR
jgi:shikimate kinase